MHLQYLKRFYPDFKNKKILDLGCGRGDFLLECHKEKIDVIGIDINPNYIKISKEKIKGNGFEPNIIQGRGEELPFEDNYFDFVNCVDVLEHTQNPQKVLSEIYRVLKKGGRTFITIQNRLSVRDGHYNLLFINWMPRFLGKIYGKSIRGDKNPYHCPDIHELDEMHYYTYFRFKKIAKELGFRIEDTRKNQLNNPDLILNKRFKNFVLVFKKIKLDFIIDLFYSILKNFYFNTFHLILIK